MDIQALVNASFGLPTITELTRPATCASGHIRGTDGKLIVYRPRVPGVTVDISCRPNTAL